MCENSVRRLPENWKTQPGPRRRRPRWRRAAGGHCARGGPRSRVGAEWAGSLRSLALCAETVWVWEREGGREGGRARLLLSSALSLASQGWSRFSGAGGRAAGACGRERARRCGGGRDGSADGDTVLLSLTYRSTCAWFQACAFTTASTGVTKTPHSTD